MDVPALLRRVVATYLLSLGPLGAGTVRWSVTGLLVERSMPVARFWFLHAGFGTVLTTIPLRATCRATPSCGDSLLDRHATDQCFGQRRSVSDQRRPVTKG